MTECGPHLVRNGRQVWRFSGRVLGAASSMRVDAARWSELTVYGLLNGSYVRSKVGFSLVAHRPDCPLVDRQMTAWLDLEDRDEVARNRVPCVVCQPVVAPGMDPHTMMESIRYTATVARDAAHLGRILRDGRPAGQLPRLVLRVIEQVMDQDAVFARYWETVSSVGVKLTG